MVNADAFEILDRLCDRTLPKPEWTHEAHLAACWAALRTRSSDEALDLMRTAIRPYNVATGVANTETSGYHETITRYYVGAIASLGEVDVDDVLREDRCRRTAPLGHWSSDVLFSVAARTGWVTPDLRALPLDEGST